MRSDLFPKRSYSGHRPAVRALLKPVSVLSCLLIACAITASAQEGVSPQAEVSGAGGNAQIVVPSPILTLDQDRLFRQSLWGRRAGQIRDASRQALAAENRRIEADLTEREAALTTQRATMDPAAFRSAAADFDTRVINTRREQDAKDSRITRQFNAERLAFFTAARQPLVDILRQRGAVAILDAGAIFVADNAIDVTDEMISELDSRIGEGKAPEMIAPADDEDTGGVKP